MDGMDASSPKLTLRRTSQGKIIGHHPSIREALDTIERVAPTTCNVLVTGPSGTGKELVVAALHDASPRAQAPFVAVNCGALPENLIESMLFGHKRGAFTGAVGATEGYVGAAEGGTLYLDEIGELPITLQPKILRLLQQREYTPVGEARAIKCDIRVVAATNRDLAAEVAAGRFREDLYYRLNVVQVHLPPLCERGNDVESLALYFLQHCAARVGRAGLAGYHPDAMAAIRAWSWPGNIRELENTIERAVLLTRTPLVTLADLPAKVREHYERVAAERTPSEAAAAAEIVSNAPFSAASVIDPSIDLPDEGVDFRAAIEAYENKLLRMALDRTGNNRNQAAQLLRLNRTTLVEMLRRKRIS